VSPAPPRRSAVRPDDRPDAPPTASQAIAPPTTLTTAADALHNEEIDRTRTFLRTGWAVAAFVAAALVLTDGAPGLKLGLAAGTAIALAFSAWLHRQLRNPLAYDPKKLVALAVLCLACGQLGILYSGHMSAAPQIVLLGLYFFCRTEHAVAAIAIYVAAAGGYAVTAGLIIAGVIDDPGFYPMGTGVSPVAQILSHVVVQMAYAICFWLARLTRRASLSSIEQLQHATRIAAQREAQVDELRQDLDRALKIGGPGRFTGQVVGAWTLGPVLGRGAMGEVYDATPVGTTNAGDPTAAAVKLLRRELLADRKHVERFLREVRVASSLDSPHVVKVLQASTPEDPIPFLAMERLRGMTLGEVLRDGVVLTRPRTADLVDQIASVLEAARTAGIVHRDLKPHNLFQTDDGIWKILDFGVALLGESSGTLTQGGVVGTPAYMAPEQAKGETVDHRADLYALAACVYRCLTGRLPFLARDTPAVLYAVVHQMPIRPGAIAPVPPDVEAFLAIGLAKSRDARFASAAEFGDAYAAAERGKLSDAHRKRAGLLVRRYAWREPDPTAQSIQGQ
jgi:eukaryotic-like serine/threonine-protein kinase